VGLLAGGFLPICLKSVGLWGKEELAGEVSLRMSPAREILLKVTSATCRGTVPWFVRDRFV